LNSIKLSLKLSLATIHKTLKKLNAKPLKKPKRKKEYQRYQKNIPGERVQLDVIKIKSGVFQYTAVDDCTRYRVLGVKRHIYLRVVGTHTFTSM